MIKKSLLATFLLTLSFLTVAVAKPEATYVEFIVGKPVQIERELPNNSYEIEIQGKKIPIDKSMFDPNNAEVRNAIKKTDELTKTDKAFSAVKDEYEQNKLYTMGVLGFIALHRTYERTVPGTEFVFEGSRVGYFPLAYWNFFYDQTEQTVSGIAYEGQRKSNEYLARRFESMGLEAATLVAKKGADDKAGESVNALFQNIAQLLKKANTNQKPFLKKLKDDKNVGVDLTKNFNISKDDVLLIPYGLEAENHNSHTVSGILSFNLIRANGDIIYQSATHYSPIGFLGKNAQVKIDQLLEAFDKFIKEAK